MMEEGVEEKDIQKYNMLRGKGRDNDGRGKVGRRIRRESKEQLDDGIGKRTR